MNCLLDKLLGKTCFVFHAWAFDDVMTFEYFYYLKNEKNFRSEIKTFFLVSQVLSVRT